MGSQILQMQLDRFPGIPRGFRRSLAVGNAARKRRNNNRIATIIRWNKID
jgi:hypothetical protein